MGFNIPVLFDLCNMLAASLGRMFQITLSDREKYIYVKHTFSSSVQVGAKIHEKEAAFLRSNSVTAFPFIANYKNLSSTMNRLRGSTFFFKDDSEQVQYMLTITANVDDFVRVREIMDAFANGNASTSTNVYVDSEPLNTVEIGVHDVISDVIVEGERRFATKRSRMTTFEKQSLIREMRSRGVFLIKGTVGDVAEQLEYSEATIYRYLKKLEAQQHERN